MSALGSLVVKLAVDYAEFTGGLDKGEQAALASAKRVQDTFDNMQARVAKAAGAIAGGLAAAFTIGAFKQLIAGAVELGAALDDLSMQTGATVEALSGLLEIGRFNNMGPEQLGKAMNVLTKNLSAATDESAGTAAALKALHLDFDRFRTLRPEEQMQQIASALGEVRDGSGKAAVMMALYGKEGAKMLPFMKDLASVGELQARITTEQAAAAANLDDNWVRLTTTGSETAKEVAMGMVPALDQAVGAFLDVTNQSGGLRDELRMLVADGSVGDWASNTITGLTYVMDTFEGLIGLVRIAALAVKTTAQDAAGMASALFMGMAATKNLKFGEANDIFSKAYSDMVSRSQQFNKDFDALWNPKLKGASIREQMLHNLTAAMADAGTGAQRATRDLDGFNARAAASDKSAAALAASGADLAQSLLAQDTGLSGDFFKKWESLNAAHAAGKLGVEDLTAAQRELLEQQPFMKAALEDATKAAQARAAARNKEADGIAAWLASEQQAALASVNSARERVAALQTEEQAVELARAKNISLAEAVEQVAIARLEEKKALLREGSDAFKALDEEIAKRKELLGLLGRKDVREREERGWADMWSSVDRSAHDVFVNVLQGGQDAFKRLGNTLKTSVLDVLYQMTVRRWIISIGTSIFGAGFGMAANAATGGMAGGSGLLGMGMQGVGLYNGLTSGTGMLGTVGNWLGLGASGAVGAGAWGGAAVAGSYAAPGIGAVGSLGGVGAGGGFAATAAAVMPWLLGAAAVAALWKPLFGRTLKDSGIEGTFGESGFEGRGYKFYEGGLFRSDKTTYSALDEQVRKTLGDSYKAMREQTIAYADVLGLSTERLKGFTSSLKLSLHGLSEGDAQKKIQEALATANDELAQQVLGTWSEVTETVTRRVQSTAIEMEAGAEAWRDVEETVTRNTYTASEFAKEGERASDTLARLATSLSLANTWFLRLGATLFESSLGGADQASGFIDAMGGADAFDAQAGAYFSSYYTSTQRRAAMQREVQDTLGKAGVEMPRSAMEFRELMDAALAAGEAGRETAAALFSVAPAFAEVNGSIADLEQAMGISASSIKGILDDVRKGAATPAEAGKRLESSIYEGLDSAMTQGLSQMIMSAAVGPLVDGLLAGATGSATAMATGGVAGGAAVAGGGAAGGGAVAAGGAAAGASMAQGGAIAGAAVASTIEQARAYMDGFAAIMNDPAVRDTIRQIADGFGDIAGDLAGVTGGFQSAGTAMNYASGAASGMADSVTGLGDSIEEEIKRLRGLMVEDSPAKGKDFLLAEFTSATAAARAGDQTALARLPELSQQLEAATRLTAGSSVELARMRGWLAGSLEQTRGQFTVQTDAQRRAAMLAMNEPGYDIRDTPRYANTWDANPIYTPWEEGTIDSRYDHWFGTTPRAGTGNLRGQDPNAAPDIRYTGGGIGAEQYDARDPNYMEDWRYRDTWSADPYLRNPRPGWYGRSYEIGTNYVPSDGPAYLHEGEAVVPKAYNPAAGGRDAVVAELQALRRDLAQHWSAESSDKKGMARMTRKMTSSLDRIAEGALT